MKHVSVAAQRTRRERVMGMVGHVSSLKYVLWPIIRTVSLRWFYTERNNQSN